MENAALPPPAIPLFAPPRADFADWLSPMLVKELRQGVRTRVFVFLFILLQVFMLLDLVLSLVVAAAGESASEGAYFFWFMVAVPTLLIIPISGLSAVGREIRGNTLELVFLTRLTAFRIVVGKWFALFVQSLLLVCAVLPYLVLRYFIGGVNLANELLLLGALLVGSALLIGMATGLSAFPARVVRPLAVAGGLVAFYIGTAFFFSGFIRGRMTSTLPDLPSIGTALVCSVILLLLMLDAGAARIAPPAENHSGVMRLLACAGLLVAMAAQLYSPRSDGVLFGAFVVAVVVCAVAVCEQPRAIPSIYRPFTRWGWLGQLAGRFFYPGWHTGVLYTLAMFTAFGALLVNEKMFRFNGSNWITDGLVWFVATLGTLLMPVALIQGFLRRTTRPAVLFCAIQTACLITIISFNICDSVLRTDYRELITFVPLCALLAGPAGSTTESGWRLLAVSVTTALSVIILLVASVPAFRRTRQMERESLNLPAPPKNSPRPDPAADPHAPLA